MTKTANRIIHVAFVLDASTSMTRLASKLVEVTDEQIKFLAKRSEELDVETRVSVYTFADRHDIKCVIFDKDVFRLPSIKDLYQAHGNTALIDATILSQNDLAMTMQKYGEHSFLTFVLTDGEENNSQASQHQLAHLIQSQSASRAVAALVPDDKGRRKAIAAGFPEGNVVVWEVSRDGLVKAGSVIREATNSYMTTVSTGGLVDKTSIFGTGADKVNKDAIIAAGLVASVTATYDVIPVGAVDVRIDEFVRASGHVFRVGRGYYEFTKTEIIQGNKDLAILEKATGKVFRGEAARRLLGLSDLTVRVKPDQNPEYTIFVQSTANNRKLLRGTRLVYFHS